MKTALNLTDTDILDAYWARLITADVMDAARAGSHEHLKIVAARINASKEGK